LIGIPWYFESATSQNDNQDEKMILGNRVAMLLNSGRPVVFNRKQPIASRTIAASMIIEAIRQGNTVEIRNAVVSGLLDLRNASIQAEIRFLRCHFREGVNFSYGTLERNLTFAFCEFAGDANFQSMTCNYDLHLNHCNFNTPTIDFRNLHVNANFSARHVTFRGIARFDDAEFGPDVDFGYSFFEKAKLDAVRIKGSGHFDHTVFELKANFTGIDVEHDLDFTRARFLDAIEAQLFDVMNVGVDLAFVDAIFAGDVSFDGMRIQGSASFDRAQFDKGIDFADVKVAGDLTFEDAKISGESKLVGMTIGGGGIFREAKFNNKSRARFDLTHFEGGLFCQGVTFTGDVDFRGAQIDLIARFVGATFEGTTSFEATKFTGLAQFNRGEWSGVNYPGPTFGPVSFKHARFEHDAHFDDALFLQLADFRDTSFRIVYFSTSGTVTIGNTVRQQFEGEIDLRGCNYKAIIGNWEVLLPPEQTTVGYNRQPYTQLEKFFTDSGDPELADQVYLRGRSAERKWKWKQKRYIAYIVDVIYLLFLRYGVRPVQLLCLTMLLLVMGTLFFSQPRAVVPKEKTKLSFAQMEKTEAPPTQLCPLDAFELSLHQFLPVEISMGEQWVPSNTGIVAPP
jgi:hypothetical protein